MNTIPHPGEAPGMTIDEAFRLLNAHVDSLVVLADGLAGPDTEAAEALLDRLKEVQLAIIVLHNEAVDGKAAAKKIAQALGGKDHG
jgi:hypothetical protein